jgi:two-component sensor histidine kinase
MSSLKRLVLQQLVPFATDRNTIISGSNIMLTAAMTQSLAIVLHELATNAAKDGALSTSDGRVPVIWDRLSNGDEEASLMIEWCGIDGPPIRTRNKSGYGTSLIRDLVPHELGGTVELVFSTKGVFCKIEFPLGRG